jgi:NAD(P)-dependent dehydrogenase (short-subunit alcohol dehydrogenase family)
MRSPEKETELNELENVQLEKLDVLDVSSIDQAIKNGVAKYNKIDALVNNIGTSIQWLSTRVRLLQSGIVGSYIFVMVLGIILLLSIGFLSTIL